MKTTVVYILTSDVSDHFLEQTMLSACSLRYYNPNATIVVVTDHITYATLSGQRGGLNVIVNEVVSVKVPDDLTKTQRSRYLKTNLRSIIDGDFLFIDSDTIICDSLGELDSLNCDLGAVADTNGDLALHNSTIISRCLAAGFDSLEGEPYFNSGVLYVKDSIVSRRLYELWFSNWKKSYDNGIQFDQPALCYANSVIGHPIVELSGKWNCQFKMGGYPFVKNALILHYFSNNGESQIAPQCQMLLSRIKALGEIDSLVMKLIKNPRTLFYSFLDMNEDKAFMYLTSDLLYLYYKYPKLFKLSERLGSVISRVKAFFIR